MYVQIRIVLCIFNALAVLNCNIKYAFDKRFIIEETFSFAAKSHLYIKYIHIHPFSIFQLFINMTISKINALLFKSVTFT